MPPYPIADLHCDLLSFLVDHPSTSCKDPDSRTSYPQMEQGNVAFQAFTLFSPTNKKAHPYGKKQLNTFLTLLSSPSKEYCLWDPKATLRQEKGPISASLAIENAHLLCEESETVEMALSYLDQLLLKVKNIIYISLTWDLENRFGGGVGSNVGLKEEGKIFLEGLSGKKIAIDLSHASDHLADDLLNFLEKKSLDIPILASHSNMRSITPLERNLPDFLVKEIIRKNGLIGFNFFAPFVGTSFEKMADHISHLLSLGGEDAFCFGADFFQLSSFSYLKSKYGTDVGFFPEFPNSSCYQNSLAFLEQRLHLSKNQLDKLAFGNVQSYVKRVFL